MRKNAAVISIVFVVLVAFGAAFFIWRSGDSLVVEESERTTTMAIEFGESPLLAGEVALGTLPPVGERLPKAPPLVQPEENVGTYGGVWHVAMKSKNDHASFVRTLGYENLVRWNKAWTGIVSNIAQSFVSSEDARTYTFRLRDGMKWSDGQPFTADDIVFWYEDIFLNPELSPVKPAWLTSDGLPVVVEKIDDLTVVFRFDSPNGLFISSLAQVNGAEPTSYPKHYLSQFLPKYNSDIDALVAAEGVQSWTELFVKKFGTVGSIDNMNRWQNPELPVLNAWVLTNRYGDVSPVVAKRNPYYWKIDTDGNQLPYIDSIEYFVTDSADKMLELTLAGEIDMQDRHIGNSALSVMANRAKLEKGQTLGGYGFFQTVPANMNSMAISFNLNHRDPVLRQIFQTKDFRVAVSEAIDRQAIIDKFLGGVGEPYQLAPRPESPFYDQELAKQYTEYNPSDANRLLDAMGLGNRDGEGWRLRPDGQRLSFTMDSITEAEPLEMIAANLAAVGVEMKVNAPADRSTFYERKNANEHDAVVWPGDGGLDVIQEPRYYFPFSSESNYALEWAKAFYSPDATDGQALPEAVRNQQDLYRSIIATTDDARQAELMKEILKITKEQFYAIGVSLTGQTYGVVKNEFRNVPGVMPAGWVYPNPAPTNPCQYYIEP